MKISVYGAGYVGLVTGVCFAEIGNDVTIYDINPTYIEKLNRAEIPFYEENMQELCVKNFAHGKLKINGDLAGTVKASNVHFIAVGTPALNTGEANLRYLYKCVEDIASLIEEDALIVIKSSVPVGTHTKVRIRMERVLAERKVPFNISIASNPEFLKEGQAILDFMKPDRVVVGCDDEMASTLLKELYKPLINANSLYLEMDNASAELTKYAANAMLATRISFMNEMACFAEKVGADIGKIKEGIGTDKRIGNQFLNAGVGYGGSCFPKDVAALYHQAKIESDVHLSILKAVGEANTWQRINFAQKIMDYFGGNLQGVSIAVLGLTFKPKTDDLRDAPALDLIKFLHGNGAQVFAYDPVASKMAKDNLKISDVVFSDNLYEVTQNCDAAVIMTEWNEIKQMDFSRLNLKNKVLFDGRNVFTLASMKERGFNYISVGRQAVLKGFDAASPSLIPNQNTTIAVKKRKLLYTD